MLRPTLFDSLGGIDGVLRLAHAWHVRCLADEVVAHAFSHGYHPQHSERLAAYWAERNRNSIDGLPTGIEANLGLGPVKESE